ncbi:hypothetical protein BHE74_00001185 [Ensete ventricosum]|nr:hypothetical protein BHE74_00001185 [Ensete ventricosum]
MLLLLLLLVQESLAHRVAELQRRERVAELGDLLVAEPEPQVEAPPSPHPPSAASTYPSSITPPLFRGHGSRSLHPLHRAFTSSRSSSSTGAATISSSLLSSAAGLEWIETGDSISKEALPSRSSPSLGGVRRLLNASFSYDDDDGECMVMVSGRHGIILLGSLPITEPVELRG